MRPRGGAWLLSLAAVLAAGVALPAFAHPASASPQRHRPTIVLATHRLVPGHSVAFTGHRWPGGTAIQLQLCGRKAIDGSADCLGSTAVTVSPGPTGEVDGRLVVRTPGRPCPCVVLVQTLPASGSSTIPVTVVGAPKEAVHPAPAARFAVHASVTGGWSWGSLFGLGTDRELNVTVTNQSRVTLEPVVSARWGRGGSEDNVISAPPPKPLGPAQTTTIVAPFRLGPFSHGTYSVTGTVHGSNPPVNFATTTSTTPWGLLAILALLVVLLLLKLGNSLRKARNRGKARHARDPGDESGLDALLDGEGATDPASEPESLVEGASSTPGALFDEASADRAAADGATAPRPYRARRASRRRALIR